MTKMPFLENLHHQRRKLFYSILLLLTCCLSCLAQNTHELELDAFINDSNSDGSTLCLRITNRGEAPKTVPTENYSLLSINANGRRVPYFDIRYEFVAFGSIGTDDYIKIIPSISKLAPVTIFKNETAALTMKLDQSLLEAMKEPDIIVSIRYSVGEDMAERFGLWAGTLEIQETVDSLRNK